MIRILLDIQKGVAPFHTFRLQKGYHHVQLTCNGCRCATLKFCQKMCLTNPPPPIQGSRQSRGAGTEGPPQAAPAAAAPRPPATGGIRVTVCTQTRLEGRADSGSQSAELFAGGGTMARARTFHRPDSGWWDGTLERASRRGRLRAPRERHSRGRARRRRRHHKELYGMSAGASRFSSK